MRAKLLLLVAAVSLTGCLNLPNRTSGIIGCPPPEVKITDETAVLGARNWTATCHDKVFYCTMYVGGGISCAPAVK